MSQVARGRTFWQRLADRQWSRYARLSAPTSTYTTTRDLRVPMRGGVDLLADLLEPTGPVSGTILVTSPYGWNVVGTAMTGGVFACRGYRVLLVRWRGTFGSGGTFEPHLREVEDMADTVAWMRTQPWFDGRFGTYGYSSCGFSQWALLVDPPAELATTVIAFAPHDFGGFCYTGGAFLLSTLFEWSFVTSRQEKPILSRVAGTLAARNRVRTALAAVPLADAAEALMGGTAPWYREWISHRDLTDPWWKRADCTPALDRARVPVLLQGGWQDGFLGQTMTGYERLAERGAEQHFDVALTIGPWTHAQGGAAGTRVLLPDALAWFDEHLARSGTRHRTTPVRVYVSGADAGWRDLPAWPPATTDHVLHPHPGGLLTPRPADAGQRAGFTYDPAEPTPTHGGAFITQLSPGITAGYLDDGPLAARPDVLAFTSEPLTTELEVAGSPVVELDHSSDNPHADLFVRVSEVDVQGRSRNVSDGFLRLDPSPAPGVVQLRLEAVAHRFAAGHRIRLLVAGGSHPRWERNLGTGDDPATSTRMRPSHRTIDLPTSRLVLPVTRPAGA